VFFRIRPKVTTDRWGDGRLARHWEIESLGVPHPYALWA